MTKITADHLGRGAFVYIVNRRPIRSRTTRRAAAVSTDSPIIVPGSSAGPRSRSSRGGIKRPDFERLLTAICEGRVGAVFAIEASRLARNGRDRHTLIEFCGCRDCHRRRGWDL